MKRKILNLVLAFVLVMSAVPANLIIAADSSAFFNAMTSTSGWTTNGTWNTNATNGMTVNSGTNTKAYRPELDYHDVRIECEFRPTGTGGDCGILFRVTHFASGTNSVIGYYAAYDNANKRAVLGVMNNAYTELASSANNSVNLTAGDFYKFKVEAFGATIKIYIDDMVSPVLTYADGQHIHGAVGVRAYNNNVSYRNYSAETITSTPTGVIKPAEVFTKQGTAPILPTTVSAVHNDGFDYPIEGTVTWEAIPPSAYAKAGTQFIVRGSIPGMNVRATANVTVVPDQTKAVQNPAPLVETPFMALPLGSVEARGWLKTQLDLQVSGLTGRAEEIYAELGPNSEWLGGNAANSNWERPVYYLKGLLPLAYTLKDPVLIERSQKWIEWTLENQHEDGNIGPKSDNDWWPRMVMLYCLRDYYEATGDMRVITVLTKYFDYMLKNLPARPLRDWGKQRVGDNIDVVLWLYKHTQNPRLLDLATLLRNQNDSQAERFNSGDYFGVGLAAEFADTGFHRVHVVNVNQSIRMPAVFYQLSKLVSDHDAFRNGDAYLIKNHAQATDMPNGTEFLSSYASNQGTELCAVTERMLSNEICQIILGDPYIGDQLEKIAFNALPANLSYYEDNGNTGFTGLQYYTLANQVQSLSAGHGFGQNYNSGITPSPISGYPCCRFNWHHAWPYYTKYMWAASAEGGLAVMAYGPSEVTTTLDNTVVKITEDTKYPFEEDVLFTVNVSEPKQFPLTLRIPAWSTNTAVKVNGAAQTGVVSGEYYVIDRIWTSGDVVTAEFGMELVTNPRINNSVSVEYGPLVFSLRREETWTPYNQTDNVSGAILGTLRSYTVSGGEWRYGLNIDPKNPADKITVNKGPWPSNNNPFTTASDAITLTAPARTIASTVDATTNGWRIGAGATDADEVPLRPTFTGTSDTNITLAPFGAMNIRVTNFPLYMEVADQPIKYEAEAAILGGNASVGNGPTGNSNHATRVSGSGANAAYGQYVTNINSESSYVEFANVYVPPGGGGYYDLHVCYSAGTAEGPYATHEVTVNGVRMKPIKYSPFHNSFDRYQQRSTVVPLLEGNNTIRLSKGVSQARLDYIWVSPAADSVSVNTITVIPVARDASNFETTLYAVDNPQTTSDVNLIFAAYDVDGRLIELQTETFSIGVLPQIFTTNFAQNPGAAYYKAFAWDADTFAPFSGAITKGI